MSQDSEYSSIQYARAVLNILEDFSEEKTLLEQTQKAILNILEDFGSEKQRLENTQRAVLNILEDLDVEKRNALDANRMKSEFLANMSHELRTPLNAIIGFAELMYNRKVGPISPQHREFLGDILTSSRHLLQLINDVLDLSKVEAGKMEFHPEKLNLAKTVKEVLTILSQNAVAKGIDTNVTIDRSLEYVITDGGKLKQILYNYLSNALKFTDHGGKIEVRARPEKHDFFRLEVIDDGIGISSKNQKLLFQEFRQLDSSASKKYQGTGLGLALTRRIAEAQGGLVGVSSELGEGSNFFVVLPRDVSFFIQSQ